jgi:hypothetical protein
MPCQSYDTDWYEPRRGNSDSNKLKAEADKLARIACRAMNALEAIDPSLSMIQDAETRAWYAKHKKADEARRAKEATEKAKKDAEEKLRKDAMAKLTPEEIEAFGLKPVKKVRGKK